MSNYYEQWKTLSERINSEVPIEDVLALHGINPVSRGKYRLREDDDTPSASVFKAKNQIHDFGDNNSFNCCSFTAWFNDISYKEATAKLAESFGYEIPEHGKTETTDKLSNREWSMLDIQGDAASKNMVFFPEKYGHERTRLYAEKFRVPMSELKETDMATYERIVRSKGVAHVMELKNAYYAALYNEYLLQKTVGNDLASIDTSQNKQFFEDAKALSFAENVLMKAINGTSINYKPGQYNVERDFRKVINGDIQFEIGPRSQFDIQKAAYYDKAKPFYCLVSLDEYYKLLENGLENIQYAAKQKGSTVSLSFVSTDSSRVNFLVRALRGKERNIVEGLEEQPHLEGEQTEDMVLSSDDNAHLDKLPPKECLDIN